jgi:eukaryotic-like serine/threonine-protein kinase
MKLEALVKTEVGDPDRPDASGDVSAAASPRHDRYRRVGEIGRGGMGTVYSVRDLPLSRLSAMKVLSPRLAEQRAEVQRFLREARITAQLDHPNIVPVHEIGTDDEGNLYFTMKQVEGRTLHAWIAELQHPPSHPEAFNLMMESFLRVCDAVAFAHSRGVIHCDIKPENIMVGRFGQVYVMDWGVAEILAERPPTTPGAYRPLTGTPSFMSPEQASRLPLDERSDVFALGALLYTILTGRAPYDEDDTQAALAAARACTVAFPPGLSGLPTLLCDVALRAMCRDPDQRHQNVLDLRRDVEASLHALPFSTETFPAGARIVVEGEPGDSAYIIVSGSCVAYRTVAGERRVLRRLPAGAAFGEMAVLSGKGRTATVEAETDVVVSVVSRALLERNLGLGTRFGAFVLALVDRFRELDDLQDGGALPGAGPGPGDGP